ncbi:MAG: hypothetical protein KAS23_05905 [Anaerohalosphaera sp.]|nr:hypothetical protein [Anaerohalosphaera sp.]
MRINSFNNHIISATFCASIIFAATLIVSPAAADDWSIAGDSLKTRWANEVSPENAHPEYPRPQMERSDWANLNGLWEYAITAKDAKQPTDFDGQILVPFCIESALSGVMKTVGPNNRLWYKKTFTVPSQWKKERLLLHFGAVDWDTEVFVNGRSIGAHKGGYDPFSFDITDAVAKGKTQEIVVSVLDPTDAGYQPRGKQVQKPRGIWYTSVTGIWQTVWIESVPKTYIKSIKILPDIDDESVYVTVGIAGGKKAAIYAETALPSCCADSKQKISGMWGKPGEPLRISIPKPKLWSPDSPYLYDLKITLYTSKPKLLFGGKRIDSVTSYFGMRKIELAKDEQNINRLFLNNKPLFQYGPLDQGWWPDGLYTAPTDEALKYDIEVTKQLGFNMLRKHVKIEPARFYYWCDKLGVLVWQDMPSGDKYIGGNDPDLKRTKESANQFQTELKALIDTFYSHPSIVMWVPFNEGWGQFDTERITKWIKDYDPSRLVNNTSGWADRKVGDVYDIHAYPGPAAPANEEKRAVVLGEFGGLGLPEAEHTWQEKGNWGYRSYKDSDELTNAYNNLIQNLRPLIYDGLSAAVYTQTTDVEIEINGLMTYDRDVIKMNAAKVKAINNKLYMPPPIVKTVVACAKTKKLPWRYTFDKPVDSWQKPGFDDSAWKQGTAGFGTETTPGAIVGTKWDSSDIWLRRTFTLDTIQPNDLQLTVHHDEDAVVYINGVEAAEMGSFTGSYVMQPISDAAKKTLKTGINTIAIHCRQTNGGQYIDAGIVSVTEQK